MMDSWTAACRLRYISMRGRESDISNLEDPGRLLSCAPRLPWSPLGQDSVEGCISRTHEGELRKWKNGTCTAEIGSPALLVRAICIVPNRELIASKILT